MPNPQLYVFAGPNGAGKSTFAKSLLPENTPVFDGDKKFAELKSFFYDLDESLIWRAVNEIHFPEWKSAMIQDHKTSAFETNFRDPSVMDSVNQFINAGYQARLMFMGLDSYEISVERVSLRVEKGGHGVPLDFIKINFEQSLINLNKFYDRFTSTHLYQNFSSPEKESYLTPLLNLKEDVISVASSTLPEWASTFQNIVAKR